MSVVVREKKQGSGTWWLFINHHGKRKSKKIGTDKFEAVRLAKILEGRLAAGDLQLDDINQTAKSFSFYCQRWLTVTVPIEVKPTTKICYDSLYRCHLKTAPFFSKPVNKITRGQIKTYLLEKMKTRSWSTCKHIKNAISLSFAEAIDDEVVVVNPCIGIKIKRKKDDVTQLAAPYTPDQIESLLNHLKGTKQYLFVLLLARSGVRVGEGVALEWDDVDLKNRRMEIKRSITKGIVMVPKNGKARFVDLTPELTKELRKQKLQSTCGLVFANRKKGYINPNNFRSRIYHPACEAAGLHRTRLHDLRHSYASSLIRISQNIYYASKQLGHSSIDITDKVYNHLIRDDSPTRPVDVLDQGVG